MSTPETRPPRTTPNFGFPVPGDGGPADAPTVVGDLADAVDAWGEGREIPYILHGERGYDLPANPGDGQRVLVGIEGATFHDPAPEAQTTDHGFNKPIWELVALDGWWRVIGGQPMRNWRLGRRTGWGAVGGVWAPAGPTMLAPYPDMWIEPIRMQANLWSLGPHTVEVAALPPAHAGTALASPFPNTLHGWINAAFDAGVGMSWNLVLSAEATRGYAFGNPAPDRLTWMTRTAPGIGFYHEALTLSMMPAAIRIQ